MNAVTAFNAAIKALTVPQIHMLRRFKGSDSLLCTVDSRVAKALDKRGLTYRDSERIWITDAGEQILSDLTTPFEEVAKKLKSVDTFEEAVWTVGFQIGQYTTEEERKDLNYLIRECVFNTKGAKKHYGVKPELLVRLEALGLLEDITYDFAADEREKGVRIYTVCHRAESDFLLQSEEFANPLMDMLESWGHHRNRYAEKS